MSSAAVVIGALRVILEFCFACRIDNPLIARGSSLFQTDGPCCNLTLSRPGPGCSKLTTPLVNVSLKIQTLIFEIFQYFVLKKCVQKLLSFFQQKNSVYLVIKL